MDAMYRTRYALRKLGGSRTCAEIANVTQCHPAEIATCLEQLVASGEVEHVDIGCRGWGWTVPAFRLPFRLWLKTEGVGPSIGSG